MLGSKIKLLTITLLTLLSTVTLSAQSITVAYQAKVEPGQAYLFGDQVLEYADAGVYYATRTIPRVGVVGDSIINLTLYVCEDITVAYEATVQIGETYLFGDQPLSYTAAGDYSATQTLKRAGSDCDSIINLTLHVVPACENITVAYEATVEVGQTYLFGDQSLSYATAGDYPATQTLKRAGSECDSIINLTLHVVPACEDITVAYEATVEVGQTYLFGDQTLSYATAGDYPATQTLKRAGSECDSIINLTLHVVVPCEDITVAYDAEIEAGQTYLFGDVAYHYGDSETGLYVLTRTIPRVGGCDSTIILNLTVKAGGGGTCEDITVAYEATITLGQTYLFGDKAITPTAVGDVTDQRTIKRENYDCDSIINLTLHVVVPCEDITVAYEATVEVGQTYLFGDQALSYADPGDYPATQTIKRQGNNCDSIINLTLHVIVPCEDITVAYETTIEPNQTYLFGDQALTYPLEGDYNATKTIKRVGTDCDSIINLTLHVKKAGCATVTYTPADEETVFICGGESYKWAQNNVTYLVTADTTCYDTIQNPLDECDSLVYTLHIKVQDLKLMVERNIAICPAESYVWKEDGVEIGTYTAADAGDIPYTAYYKTLNYKGQKCDSVQYTLHLTVHGEAPVIAVVDTICLENLPYVWLDPNDGFKLGEYDKAGDYTASRKYAGGCDSVKYTLKLRVDSVADEDRHEDGKADVYYGYPFLWKDGKEYIITQDTTFYYAYKHAGTLGCDSAIYRTKVTMLDIEKIQIYDSATVCVGTSYPEGARARVITTDSAWVDSVRVEEQGVPVDKFYHYNMYVFTNPSNLPDTLMNGVHAICGMPLDTANAQAAIEKYLKDNFFTLRIDTNATISWYVKRAGSFVPRANEEITASEDEIEFQCVVADECDDTQDAVFTLKIPVEDPPMADLEKEKILVEKYGQWLLMLHVNKLKRLGYVFTEEDVDWYLYVDGVNDKLLDHHGYYYTIDEPMTGKYYVIINATSNENGCNAAAKSNLVDWSRPAKAPMRLIPNIGPEGTMMRLENIDPDQESVICAYDEAGGLMWTKTVSGEAVTEIRAEGIPGIYMIRVVTGDKVETLRYVIR